MHRLGRNAVNSVVGGMGPDLTSRERLIESSHEVAVANANFIRHTEAGDRHRDNRDWQAAEAAYAAALSLYPYERSFWVQHGHMAKEQEDFPRAEISYRTGLAFGASTTDVQEHLRFVMARQGVDEWRYAIRAFKSGPARLQVPGKPDVDLFAKLTWRVGAMSDMDMLHLLRTCDTCDQLLAAMIGDPRFERANRTWLELVREDEL